jgi:hypothetical protein
MLGQERSRRQQKKQRAHWALYYPLSDAGVCLATAHAFAIRQQLYFGRVKRPVLLGVTVAAGALLLTVTARHVLEEAAQKRRAISYQSALLTYSQRVRPGMTRKEVEEQPRIKGARFTQRCCTEDRSAFSDLVRVGEEAVPWYCSEWPVYVAFEFVAAEPNQLQSPLKPAASDVLRRIELVGNGEGCL